MVFKYEHKNIVIYEQVWFMSDDILAYEYGMTLRSVLVMTQAGSQVSVMSDAPQITR